MKLATIEDLDPIFKELGLSTVARAKINLWRALVVDTSGVIEPVCIGCGLGYGWCRCEASGHYITKTIWSYYAVRPLPRYKQIEQWGIPVEHLKRLELIHIHSHLMPFRNTIMAVVTKLVVARG